VCVLTLALGIGASTAMFTVINAVLIRPVPGLMDPGGLLILERLQKNNPDFAFGYPDYLDYRDQASLLRDLRLAAALRSHSVMAQPSGSLANWFRVTTSPCSGEPSLGRLIGAEDVQRIVMRPSLW